MVSPTLGACSSVIENILLFLTALNTQTVSIDFKYNEVIISTCRDCVGLLMGNLKRYGVMQGEVVLNHIQITSVSFYVGT